MYSFVKTLAVVSLFLLCDVAIAQKAKEADPIFASHDVLSMTLTAPMVAITRERPDEQELPGTLRVGDDVYDVQVRTRGKFRRQKEICNFPPIRLNFKKSQTKNTALHGLDKVKLVTHCRDRSKKYEQVILREYLAYRILNALTDISFRVRLLRLTYVDSEGKQPDRTAYSFVIEHRDRMARRTGKAVVTIPRTSVDRLDSEFTNLVSVYQYLIGNTDFSPIAAAPGEDCCHNHELFGNENEPQFAVPYDFDQAGIVNAPHAGPNPRFDLRDVRQRLYRGRCVNNRHLDQTIAYFVSKKSELLALVNELEGLSKNSKRGTITYIGQFYKTIENPKSVERRLIKACI